MRALTRFAFALFVGMTLCLAAATFVEKAARNRIRRPDDLSQRMVRPVVGFTGRFGLDGRRGPGSCRPPGRRGAALFIRFDFTRGVADLYDRAERIRPSAGGENRKRLFLRNVRRVAVASVRTPARPVRNCVLSGNAGSGGLPQPGDGGRRTGYPRRRRVDEPRAVVPGLPFLPNVFRRRPAREHSVGQPGTRTAFRLLMPVICCSGFR